MDLLIGSQTTRRPHLDAGSGESLKVRCPAVVSLNNFLNLRREVVQSERYSVGSDVEVRRQGLHGKQ